MKLKIFKRDVDTFKYFPNSQKHMTDLEIHDELFPAFTFNFQAPVIQLSN